MSDVRTDSADRARRSAARPTPWRSPFRALALVAVFAGGVTALSPSIACSQFLDASLWTTNGAVSAVAASGNTLYIGGTFSRVSPACGGFLSLDATTGAAAQPYPSVAGTVYSTAADGAGGWFIGGDFSMVQGQPRAGLAHLDASGNVTPWNPGVDEVGGPYLVNAQVRAVRVSGSTVYVGGIFTHVGGAARSNIAALDATTGAPTAWDPSADYMVSALEVSGGIVYVGGQFAHVGGQPRSRLAALDPVANTNNATSWNPGANDQVAAISVWQHNLIMTHYVTVFVGGYFTAVGGQSRNGIAEIDATSGGANFGQVAAWNPSANGTVYALRALGILQPTVYVGGNFTSIGGQARNGLAQLDVNAAATAWNPHPEGPVYAMELSGSLIYVGGFFRTVGGQPRGEVAAIDVDGSSATFGQPTAWNPDVNYGVMTLAVSGSNVAAGGFFTGVGGVARSNLAALDLTTGQATAWDPGANFGVKALILSDGKLYAGGSFTTVGGQTRNHVAAIDPASGGVLAWNPNLDADVEVLAAKGGVVYAGGAFVAVGGLQFRPRLAAFDTSSGQATSWSPGADSTVVTLAVSGDTVYAGGLFRSAGGQTRSHIVALRASTNIALDWNPNANGTVASIVPSGGKVYVGGNFTSIGGQSRMAIAALDPTLSTNNATAWAPEASSGGATGWVNSLAVAGRIVYAAGTFTTIGGQPRSNLAALDANTNTNDALSWNPGALGFVQRVSASNGRVFADGNFPGIDRTAHANLAVLTQAVTAVGEPTPTHADDLRASPDPFREDVDLRFSLPRAALGHVAVYDLAGRMVRTLRQGRLPAGDEDLKWDGRDEHGLPAGAGLYLVRVEAPGESMVGRIVRVR